MATSLTQIAVQIADPRQAQIVPYPSKPPSLQFGQILIKVSKFVLTANTVTYAMAGLHPELQYFAHYPYPNPTLALSPCWGTGIVTASKCPGIEVGLRIHGFYAMAPYAILQPKPRPSKHGQFEDITPHRLSTLVPYRTYFIKPLTTSENYEDLERTDGVLFSTGWGMAHSTSFLSNPPDAMVLTSASSRTAICAAFSAKHANNGSGLGFQVIGLTSQGNLDYVRSLDLYDVVYTYDDIKSMNSNQTIVVQDCTGSPSIQANIRLHYQHKVIGWSSVGMTHVNPSTSSIPPSRNLYGGTKAASFLVFIALQEAAKIYGRKMQTMLNTDTKKYLKWKIPTFETERSYGAKAALKVYQKTVANASNPGITYVCSLWPDHETAWEGSVAVANSRM